MRWPVYTCTESASVPDEERDLRARVCAEFREMPGLKLTIRQAARLFAQDSRQCERALGAMVNRGELATNGEAFALPHVEMRPLHIGADGTAAAAVRRRAGTACT